MVHPVPGGPTLPERRRGGRKKVRSKEHLVSAYLFLLFFSLKNRLTFLIFFIVVADSYFLSDIFSSTCQSTRMDVSTFIRIYSMRALTALSTDIYIVRLVACPCVSLS